MSYIIGCDLGGTNLRAGLVNIETGEVSALTSIPTQAREGHQAVIRRIAGLVKRVILESKEEPEQITAIGVGVPGVLDLEKGLVLFLPNLSGTWPNVPLRDELQSLVGLPVAILNDARAITLGEWTYGAGRGSSTMACFTLGTGVGGGLVINGELHMGFNGTAGELGHQTINFNGPKCGCGNRGCLEAYASGPAIAAAGMKAVAQGLTTSLGELVNYDLNRITPKIVYQAAKQGDAIAQEIFDLAGEALGVAIGNVMVSISPQRVVLCGGVARASDLLLPRIWRTIKERVTVVPVDKMEILPGQTGDNAGVLGAAAWAHSVTAQLGR